MHTRIGYQILAIPLAMPGETGIIFVSGSTGTHAIITASTAIEIDHHGGRAVDKPLIHKEFQEVWINSPFVFPIPLHGNMPGIRGDKRSELRRW
jgi:hypothetical protein